METTLASPQFMYVLMALPGLFCLTLLGDGISKVIHQEEGYGVCFIIGFIFLIVVGGVYFFFSANFVM